ncbi:hypothetical protein CI610_00321 [invertebrate metagenome]|uniref:Uncharacterized protein n=1 Tax=invertebrate metagenome TaxID=1711999 RepID=A0A2H9TBN9_9ZZZZ
MFDRQTLSLPKFFRFRRPEHDPPAVPDVKMKPADVRLHERDVREGVPVGQHVLPHGFRRNLVEVAVHRPPEGMLAGRAVIAAARGTQAGFPEFPLPVPVVDDDGTEPRPQVVQGDQHPFVDQLQRPSAPGFVDVRRYQFMGLEEPRDIHGYCTGRNQPGRTGRSMCFRS